MKMENFIAVKENTEGILGKFLYYSLSNTLIDKKDFIDIGKSFNLAKIKPSRESASDAFRCSTGDLYGRIVGVDFMNCPVISKIYCRDNNRSDSKRVCRELVKETLGSDTNKYIKLANIFFDKENDSIDYDNVEYDSDVDTYFYCNKAIELFELYRNCYGKNHIDTVIESLLIQMQASKISVYGKLFFVPKTHLSYVTLLEDYVAELNAHNKNDTDIVINSMYVVDDEKQRAKMTQEFYTSFKSDIEFYQERVGHFISSGCESPAVINRWISKISALEQKKKIYSEVLKNELTDLDDEFSLLILQSSELKLRNSKLRNCA